MLRQAHTLAHQLVEGWSRGRALIKASEVAVTHVIGENQYDIRSLLPHAASVNVVSSPMPDKSQDFDRSTMQAVVAAAAEEFDAEILLFVRDGSKMRLGASESGGLNARVILSHCLNNLNQLEAQTPGTTTRAFVRVVSEDLKNDQVVLLIVRGRNDIRLASGVGAQGKVRDMLNDALQAIGGQHRRR